MKSEQRLLAGQTTTLINNSIAAISITDEAGMVTRIFQIGQQRQVNNGLGAKASG
jgi:hypothetical protein